MYEKFDMVAFETFLGTLNVNWFKEYNKGEWVYYVPVYLRGEKTNKRLAIRSSLNRAGVVDGRGENSIRAWVEYNYKDVWRPLTKGETGRKWLNRAEGWEERLREWLRELWKLAIEDCKKK